MAEYTEEDLARELAEEMKREEQSYMREQQAANAAAQSMNVGDGEPQDAISSMPTGPTSKRRGPPRRRNGSNTLQNYVDKENTFDE